MWKMQTTVNAELYDNGYYLTGEDNRVDIVDSEGNKYFEIFFFGKGNILIMSESDCYWAEHIWEIFVSDDDGEPTIYYY